MANAAESLFTVDQLRVDIPTAAGTLHAVRNVSFSLNAGEILGIVGESGCGKTLTALSLLGLLPQRARRSSAALQLRDQDLLAMPEHDMAERIRGKRIAMIFQDPMTSLNPVYTIGRQLAETLTLHQRVSNAQATERAVYLLEKVGITGAASRLGQYPHQLSGGQRQRVMIAMALMNGPELIIADEPTTALDVTIQAQILHLLAGLQREFGMAMILITHNLGIVARIADTVAIMYAGEIVESAPAAQLFTDPQHPYTRRLLGCLPHAGSTAPGTRLETIPGLVPSLIGTTPGCAYYGRCHVAEAVCATAPAPLMLRGTQHSYRCIHVEEKRAAADNHPAPAAISAQPGVSPPSVPFLAVRDVRCSFQVSRGLFRQRRRLHAVNGVSFDLRKGEILAVVGESGCGKSTLARILLGLQATDSGCVELDGKSLSQIGSKALARRVQPIFQDPYASLNPRKTLAEIVRRPLDLHDVGQPEARARQVKEILSLTGLSERLLHSYPNQLSGGQRQRVAIARAIIMRPEILVCDEPTSALDVSVQAQILNLLLDLREQIGLTYLFITHDLSVVRHIADRVAVMYLGEIVEIGEARAMFDAPRHPYTRALLDSVMTVSPQAGVPDTHIGHSYPNPLEIPSGCTFHPRCPQAMPVCSTRVPTLAQTPQALVRCHLYSSAQPG
jgi:peptide/nickel transport system ATP-binding protein